MLTMTMTTKTMNHDTIVFLCCTNSSRVALSLVAWLLQGLQELVDNTDAGDPVPI